MEAKDLSCPLFCQSPVLSTVVCPLFSEISRVLSLIDCSLLEKLRVIFDADSETLGPKIGKICLKKMILKFAVFREEKKIFYQKSWARSRDGLSKKVHENRSGPASKISGKTDDISGTIFSFIFQPLRHAVDNLTKIGRHYG